MDLFGRIYECRQPSEGVNESRHVERNNLRLAGRAGPFSLRHAADERWTRESCRRPHAKDLGALTSSTVKGVLVGTVVTAVIQSSSATTVMLVSFVNAGLMTLKQAVGVIMGANIGTTITAQLIAFDLAAYALPAVGLGFLLFFFAKKEAWKNTGEIILGFGILFLGMTVLTGAVKPLRTSPVFVHWMTSFAAQPLLGVAVGAVITMIIQSSSASTGILLAVASQGLISLDAALYVLFGCNIGTCITAMLASIGTNITAKRTALAHVLFNLLGL